MTRPRSRDERTRAALALCATLVVGCPDGTESAEPADAAPSASPLLQGRALDETIVPPIRRAEPNPLGLPMTSGTFAAGAFVYAVPEAMLAVGKVGRSFELRAARVEAMDGRDVIVRIGTSAAYSVHPAYLIAPRPGRVRRGSLVLVPHHGRMRHGVVQRQTRNHIVVRYGDVGVPLGDQNVLPNEVGLLGGGFEPGSYATTHESTHPRLVQLVSVGVHPDGVERWLALGEEGEARLIPTAELSPMPDARTFKSGRAVLVAWRGNLVPGTVKATESTGLITVKRAHLGPALLVGPDMAVESASPNAD